MLGSGGRRKERLPADDVVAAMAAMAAMAGVSEAMRANGSYGAPVPVPHNADVLTRLLALAGRCDG